MSQIPLAARVTGAGRGLGASLVRALRTAGVAKVYAAHRVLPVSAFAADGIVPIQLDVTVPANVRRAAEIALDVTLVIKNAGVLPRGSAMTIDEGGLHHAMKVNYYGPLRIARAFTPSTSASGGGTIVNVLSLLSLFVEPHFAAYCASKWASWAMAQALAEKLLPRGVAVLAAFPGGIDTDMLAGVPAAKARPAGVAGAIVRDALTGTARIFPDRASQAFVRQ